LRTRSSWRRSRWCSGQDWKLASLNYRAAEPFSDSAQPLQACDMGLLPDAQGYCVFTNSIWNARRLHAGQRTHARAVPGSRQVGDVRQPASRPRRRSFSAAPGDVHSDECPLLWHSGAANRTSPRPALSLHGFFVRGDQPQQQYQKRLLRPETIATLSPELRRVLALDDPRSDELAPPAAANPAFCAGSKNCLQ
jgi:hypothetical protein